MSDSVKIQHLNGSYVQTDISGNGLTSYLTVFGIIIVVLYLLKKWMCGGKFDTSKYDLTGKYAIVTGGNSGIGKQTVLELIRLNCNVIIGARDKRKSQQVVKKAKQIISSKPNTPSKQSNPTIDHYYLDLGSKKSIEEFSKQIKSKTPHIEYLVNNAGVSLISTKTLTEDGFEIMYGVNHLGHFYLTYLLIDLLKKSPFFRIVNVSSMAHKKLLGFGSRPEIEWQNLNFSKQGTYEHNLAYSRSKLCNVLFTKGLSLRIPPTKGLIAALHPGVVQSQITRHQPFLSILIKLLFPVFWLFTKNNWQGAQTTLSTLLNQNIQSGEYYADCKKDSINKFAQDEKNVQKLWSISEKDLGIKFDINL